MLAARSLVAGSGANVHLEFCKFSFCEEHDTGGGGIFAYSGSVSLYVTSFSDNVSSGGQMGGADVRAVVASITVHSTCPERYGGTPEEGKTLRRAKRRTFSLKYSL